ncbi:MAG: hypothetical protein R3272_07965 [Candidatus Promineifilaceae bacterium]|nr:hypothetical protein [Candidatus Promineifilaceae bacterium]
MDQGITGTGELQKAGQTLCTVHYDLRLAEGETERFTLTDGLIQIESLAQGLEGDAVDYLEPFEPFTLRLEHPLADGRRELSILVEPYEGHRPDERYQVRLAEEN